MLKVKLVFRNGIHQGKHIVLRKEKFVIGSSEKADLHLDSNRVSRHHCMIWCRENSVTVEDLGSLNGVRLNGNVIESHRRHPLYHGDIVDVEEWRFRMSVRHRASNEPIESGRPAMQTLRPPAESTDAKSNKPTAAEPNESMMLNDASGQISEVDLWLKELDELLDDASGSNHKIKPAGSEQRQAGPIDTKEVLGSPNEGLLDPVLTTDRSEKKDGTSREVSESNVGDQVLSQETAKAKDDENQDKTSSKLPSHLRPTGPVDSVDAAEQALKRLFG